MGHLQPVYPPMGCTQYINLQNEVKLILKENILSVTGDAFDVQIDPQDGQHPYPIFKVDPSFITSKKAFYDMQDNHLFDLRKEHFHLVHKTFKAVDPQGNKFFEVKSGIQLVGSKATASFTSTDGREETLVVKGNWRDSTADIVDVNRGVTVAQIHRKSKFKSFSTFAFDQNSYSLNVAPGVDYALMAALCVAFDEFHNDA